MITQLLVHCRRLALAQPFVTAVRRADHLDVTLVEARDDSGRSGWGEAAVSWRVTGESPESVTAAVEGPLADAMRGRDAADPDLPDAISAAVWGNAAARSAVECAVLDLAAQRAGETFGAGLGAGSLSVRTDMTLSAASIPATEAAAGTAVAQGFGTIKLKVNAATDLVALMRAVRSAIGDDVRVRIDANQAWSTEDAIECLRGVESAGIAIELVEQPVAAADIAGLAEVRRRVGIPILADEAVRTADDLDRILALGAADAVNLKLAKSGGPTAALRLAARAHDAGVGVLVGCMLESAVGVASAAAVAGACAPDRVHDLDGGLWLVGSPVVGGAHYDEDRIILSSLPGLGIQTITEGTR
ncbi:mandelate racemase/muconate lactonizing enzyme family protein [Microbacterium sp. ZW T5_56]|uniref:mandelate racemase/muconate lactonizing enzyme family protein n=1 Tax=Microbacterium sp. ZW T5_56 TaxID=3378081 RepID=UPI0038547360